LPIASDIVDVYVRDPLKLPWYIDLLNITLGVNDREDARRRTSQLRDLFHRTGARITENLDF
jgi:malate synthase